MQPSVYRFIPLVAVTLSLFLIMQTVNAIKVGSTIGENGTPSNIITVSGQGEAFAVPDIATFSFGAQATGKDVAEAQEKVEVIIKDALTKVKALGIEDKDIQTSDYSANPKYEYTNGICSPGGVCRPSTPTLVGYDVNETITVKVRKVEDAGKILGAVGGTGVTNVSGLSFTVDDRDAIEREARAEAIEDAKTKAEALAKDLDVKIVRIVSFSENNGGYPQPMYMKTEMATGGAMDAQVAPSLPVGQNKVSSNVTITYQIR